MPALFLSQDLDPLFGRGYLAGEEETEAFAVAVGAAEVCEENSFFSCSTTGASSRCRFSCNSRRNACSIRLRSWR